MSEDSSDLTARQREFIRQYVAGDDGVRGNATASYKAAGYDCTDASARVSAHHLLKKPEVVEEIRAAHRRAQAEAMGRLIEWKELAPEAQQRLVTLARGRLPNDDDPTGGEKLEDGSQASVARVIESACNEILERAYPKKLRIENVDPREELAKILGVDPDVLPDEES